MVDWKPDHLDEIRSLIDNEQRCVSIGGVSERLGLNRPTASQLLEHITNTARSSTAEKKSYEITKCVVETTNAKTEGEFPCTGKFQSPVVRIAVQRMRTLDNKLTPLIYLSFATVFKLVKEQDTADNQEKAVKHRDDGIVFAVARYTELSSESIWTAHEREMANFRDSMQNRSWIPWNQTQAPFIAPAPAFMRTTPQDKTVRPQQHHEPMLMMNLDDEDTKVARESSRNGTSSMTNRLGRGTKKVTTAATFFGKAKTTTSSSGIHSKATTTSTTTLQEDGKENRKQNDDPAHSSNAKAEVGNADDFIGDMDDEDDDEHESNNGIGKASSVDAMDVDEPKETNVSKKKQRKSQTKMVIIDDDDNDHDNNHDEDPAIKKVRTKKPAAVVHGAMDSFTTVVAKPNEPENSIHTTKQRRRRKKLVDKTTVDENGYLHTETQEVWEDIPSDEEQDPASSRGLALPAKTSKAQPPELMTINSRKKSNKANMKQGNIMGFFQKK
jgi:hypothetical protein